MWVWGLVAALVIGIGVAAYHIPGTEWFQGYTRWGRVARIQPAPIVRDRYTVDTFDRQDFELRLSPDRDLRGLQEDVVVLQKKDVGETTVMHYKLRELATLAENHPDLDRVLRDQMRDIVDRSTENLLEEAKVVRVLRDTDDRVLAERVLRDKVLASFKITSVDAVESIDKVAFLIDIDAPDRVLRVLIDGRDARGTWNVDGPVYEYVFRDSVTVDSQVDVVFIDDPAVERVLRDIDSFQIDYLYLSSADPLVVGVYDSAKVL